MNELLHDLLLIIVVWLLWTYWPMWEISRQPGSLIKKKRSGGSGKESAEAKVFPGLTRKPDCPLCEKGLPARAGTPEPPPMMESKRGAPSSVDTRRQFCPQQECEYYGWLGRGNIIANGHPGGGLWRQCHCKACGCYFLETTGTVFFGKRQAVPVLPFVLAALVEGLGIRAAGRVFGLDPDTIQAWLVSAAGQLSGLAHHFLGGINVEQMQLDELYAPTLQLKPSKAEQSRVIGLAWRQPTAMVVDGDGSGEQAAAGGPGRPALPGGGPDGGPSGQTTFGAWLSAPVHDRWTGPLPDRPADPFRPLASAVCHCLRANPSAALVSLAGFALCPTHQAAPSQTLGASQTTPRLWRLATGADGAGQARPAAQHRLCRALEPFG